jgi:hypothetical protein
MSNPLDRNKRNVMAFYDLMFNGCKPAEAVRQYMGNAYLQHNPHVADSTASGCVTPTPSRARASCRCLSLRAGSREGSGTVDKAGGGNHLETTPTRRST